MNEYGFHMDATAGDVGAPVVAPAATAPGAGAPAADGAATAGGQPAPGAAGGQPGSLMARGATAATAAPAPASAPTDPAAAPAIPEKYIVKREDGTTDHEASALKLAQGYDSLAKRMGGGEAPPKTADEYAPTVPEGMSLEALKADPLYGGFLKGAHARGMNNSQLSYVLDAMRVRENLRNSPEAAEADLRREFTSDQALNQALQRSYRATAAYAGNDETRGQLEAKFGNDPDFIRLMARIGGELGEDSPPAGLSGAEAQTLESLMAHPAYLDHKHPEHARVVAQTRAMYAKKTGGT